MATVVIDYQKIINALEFQIQTILSELNSSASSEVKKEITKIKGIEVSDEQSYLKKEPTELRKGFLYIIVKFGAGSINYGSSVAPVNLMCMGTANCIKPSQILLGVFASAWTTKNLMNNNGTITDMLQVWNTPEVISNFNETNTEFRSLFRLGGNIVVGPSAVRLGTLTYIYDEAQNLSETVSIMSFQDNYGASMDSQPFGNTEGFAVSEVNFSTYTFTISTYLLDNHLSADMLAVRGFRNRSSSGITSHFRPNQILKMKLEFTNGFNNIPADGETATSDDPVLGSNLYSYYKCVGSQITQEIANIPMLTVAFTRCRKEI